jgi:anti-sigma regulatory factor (Ser/Thr protein kinase)
MAGGERRSLGTLTLPPHPTSPRAARRHVAWALEASELGELVDRATLLVSEVVTNAVLHAATDIQLKCRVERGSLCVEVRDRSLAEPSARNYDVAAMTGRGLEMVELLADEWGVETDEDGKTVWFLLAAPDARAEETRAAEAVPPSQELFDVHLLETPLHLAAVTLEHGDALLRELVLLSISTTGASRDPGRPASGIDIGPLLAQVEAAISASRVTSDLVVGFPVGAGAGALDRLATVDEADRMARDGELLTPTSMPEVAACRRWLMSQIALQADGAPPQPWSMPEPSDAAEEPLPEQVPEAERRRLDQLDVGAVLADGTNRILHVNGPAA